MNQRNNVRLLITGGGSYLGQHLIPLAAVGHDTLYTYFQNDPLSSGRREQLDLRDETAVHHLVADFQPHVIIHTAGSNRGADMEAVIRLGARHITQAAQQVNARLIHLSTDVVFRGDAPPYAETAVPTPINAYGRAKADAEAIVQTHPNHVIIRTSLIYGLDMMDHSTAWMAGALRAGQPVTLFNDQIRNPVWVNSLSQACLELAQHTFTGILNVAGCQVMSRADFGLRMLDYWGIQERASLTMGPTNSPAWSLNCELDLRLATAVLRTPLPGIDEVLRIAR
ncbi:MAG TPA: SDR family oxidoreductase [Chloroflexota bacterium]|nr:SDR family oxidoreductase [Chloroflexota bacterium]HUM67733.1 SDR family oxidoreductase [Chloroflexota bacterium]